jgi:hypothetical protein
MGVSPVVALPARESVRAVGQRSQLLPGPLPSRVPADAEELVRRVQLFCGPVLAIGPGVSVVARTTASHWPRSGSCRRSGRR